MPTRSDAPCGASRQRSPSGALPDRSAAPGCGCGCNRFQGAGGYAGALLDPSGGGLNPLAYARELARVAHAAGRDDLRAKPGSRVGARFGWLAFAHGGGEIRAARVVLAANGGNPELHPALKNTVIPLPVHEVATEVLPAEAAVWKYCPDDHVLTDIETDVFSVRWAAGRQVDKRLPRGGGCAREQRLNRLSYVVCVKSCLRTAIRSWISHGTASRGSGRGCCRG